MYSRDYRKGYKYKGTQIPIIGDDYTDKIICIVSFNHFDKKFEYGNFYDGFWCEEGHAAGMWGVICEGRVRLYCDEERFLSLGEWREKQMLSVLNG
jgi:hypothetical protein